MQRGPGQAGAAPAESVDEDRAGRPADRAGEAGEQGDAGDRVARLAAVEAGDGGEGRLVQAEAHADAEDGPGQRQADRAGREGQRRQARGEHQIGRRQHVAAAMPVDHAAGERPQQAGQQQGGREDTEEPHPRQIQRRAEIGSANTAGR